MSFKKTPYWIKGGIIGIIFTLIIHILLIFFPANSISAFFIMMPGMLLIIPFYSLWFHGAYALKIVSALFWILIFVLIGYLRGKIKKIPKNPNQDQTPRE